MENIEKITLDLIDWLKEQVNNAHAKGIVFGLSGGIDSAVVAGLAKKAFPNNSLGIIMPCHSNPQDEQHALIVAESMGLETVKVDLTNVYDSFMKTVNDTEDVKLAKANVKPRLRMTTLYYYAQMRNYLVSGCSNKSEFTVGYFTKYGDSGADILPIASFVKSEIRELARYLNIPDIIINKPPTAGLWKNQTDENEMGFSYEELDKYIRTGTGREEIVNKIESMNKRSEHKRHFPPMFTI